MRPEWCRRVAACVVCGYMTEHRFKISALRGALIAPCCALDAAVCPGVVAWIILTRYWGSLVLR